MVTMVGYEQLIPKEKTRPIVPSPLESVEDLKPEQDLPSPFGYAVVSKCCCTSRQNPTHQTPPTD